MVSKVTIGGLTIESVNDLDPVYCGFPSTLADYVFQGQTTTVNTAIALPEGELQKPVALLCLGDQPNERQVCIAIRRGESGNAEIVIAIDRPAIELKRQIRA